MNSPWMCPRCRRMNAPFTPVCFCNADDFEEPVKSSAKPSEHLKDDVRALDPEHLYKILEAEKKKAEIAIGIKPGFYSARCYVCNGVHAHGQDCMLL